MAFASHRPLLRPWWFPLTLLFVGAAATLFVTRELQRAFEAEDAERFESAVDQLQDRITDRIDTYIAMLRAGAGLIAGRPAVTESEFRAFTDSLELERRYPGIQGIGFTARIEPEDLPEVTAAVRRSVDPAFRVWPETPRNEYHAILYLEPLDRRNLAAIGYDMFTDPTRRAAMERARDTGEPAASGVVTLVQEIDEDKQPGFLIYMPVYAGGIAVPSDQRAASLHGFVYSPFRAADLFEGILGRNPRPRAGFQLFDGPPSDATLLHDTGGPSASARFSTTRTMNVAGRQWTARIFSMPALEEGSNIGLVPFVGWGGAAITLLLTALGWKQARERERAAESEAIAAAASREVQRLLASERAARQDAERDSRLKDEFLATLSHELRTPLNAVIGWAHMLAAGRLGEQKQRTAAEAILRNARAQSHLVDDLLDMSRIISGRLHMDLKAVDPRAVLQAAVEVVRPMAEAKRVALVLHLDDPVHDVRGDPDRLQQIAWNLLTNAVKFTPSGGRVEVALRERGERVELSVSDTGIGIEADFLPFVFERFRQADGSVTRSHGGLGLGLSIVRSLVEMHAGEVHASSPGPDRGATFTVSLPRAPADGRENHVDPRRRGQPLRAARSTLRGLSALVVDDDDDGRELACEILEQHGADVRRASSAMQALRLLQSGGPRIDLLISDLGMPQMDGYELIRRVRALPVEAGSTARAIALTAYVGAGDRRQALAAGFDVHLAKPYTSDELVSACLGATAASSRS